MGCDEIRETLALYAGGDVTEDERIAVESHVGVCAECRVEMEKYREARALLGGLREGDAPAGTFERMWLNVRDRAVPVWSRASRFDWIVRAAAVLVIGLGIGFVFSVSTSRSVAPVPPGDVLVGNHMPEGPAIQVGGPTPIRPPFNHPPIDHVAAPAVDGVHHLPRVEAVLSPDDVDF